MALATTVIAPAAGGAGPPDATTERLFALVNPAGNQVRGARPNALGSLSPLLQQTNIPRGVSADTLYVLFGAGSASLTPGARATLDRLGRALVSPVLAGYRYRIEGHTDAQGGPEHAAGLATERAAAVRDYLVDRFGLPPRQFDLAALGATRPLVLATHGRAEPLNRRAQVVNLGR